MLWGKVGATQNVRSCQIMSLFNPVVSHLTQKSASPDSNTQGPMWPSPLLPLWCLLPLSSPLMLLCRQPVSCFLPQGLCTCCLFCLDLFIPQMSVWGADSPISFRSLLKMLPPHWEFPWLFYLKLKTPLTTLPLSFLIAYFVFLHSTYQNHHTT